MGFRLEKIKGTVASFLMTHKLLLTLAALTFNSFLFGLGLGFVFVMGLGYGLCEKRVRIRGYV